MFTKQKKLRSAEAYKTLVPLSAKLQYKKQLLDEQLIQNLMSRNKFMVVCGPCSADNPIAMEEYLLKLKQVAVACPDLLVVARIYTSKPHSNGQGYKGFAFCEGMEQDVDLDSGIWRCREMMIKCIELGLPVADELLYPELFECLDDLVSYWFVGARSSEDSLHRDLASGLDTCCGIKNTTDGSIDKVVDSLYAVSRPCVFPYKDSQITTNGCTTAHIVLRGGINNCKYCSNIGKDDIVYAKMLLNKYGLCDFVMADLNHANSGKIARNQIENAKVAFEAGVDGVMIESYLYEGGLSSKYGTSQTDDCIGFEDTEYILKYLQDNFPKRKM